MTACAGCAPLVLEETLGIVDSTDSHAVRHDTDGAVHGLHDLLQFLVPHDIGECAECRVPLSRALYVRFVATRSTLSDHRSLLLHMSCNPREKPGRHHPCSAPAPWCRVSTLSRSSGDEAETIAS
eukprot:56225-Rhodomonas_salina.1